MVNDDNAEPTGKVAKKNCTVFDWVGANRSQVHAKVCCAAAYSADND
jgi:hypothetical protein